MNDHDGVFEDGTCPFCGVVNSHCRHLVAHIATDDGEIGGGEIYASLTQFYEAMPPDAEGSLVTDEIERILSLDPLVEFHYYTIDESTGTWGYNAYWAEDASAAVGRLLSKISDGSQSPREREVKSI